MSMWNLKLLVCVMYVAQFVFYCKAQYIYPYISIVNVLSSNETRGVIESFTHRVLHYFNSSELKVLQQLTFCQNF